MRRAAFIPALVLLPALARADSSLPQMDFSNPLTTAQLIWMVVILVALYLALSRWGLPRMGAVLANRAALIARDLDAARAAKAEADKTARKLQATIHTARVRAHAEIAEAVESAKAEAAAEAASANAALDAKLAEAERRIGAARAAAMAALQPVAEQAAAAMLTRLTGAPPNQTILNPLIEAAITARQAA